MELEIAEKFNMTTGEQSRLQVEEWLTSWFIARGKIDREAAGSVPNAIRSTDYFDAGWLTSMEVVEFVTEIEQQFGMQFSDRDLQDPRFITINGFAELICMRLARTEGGC